MTAIAPNLTCMVGELVGARLISHAGSLMGLAKHPASTVQILGAEKALFRALKTKQATPKYGLIYSSSIVGQSQIKFKGKISRVLAAKLALGARVDALGGAALGNGAPVEAVPTEDAGAVGRILKEYVEKRLRALESGLIGTQISKGAGKAPFARLSRTPVTGAAAYDTNNDATTKRKSADSADAPVKKHKA
jgi:nucleolar protein 58